MERVKPLDPYTLAAVAEAWRNRSAGVKGHAVPHEAFTHSMEEIVHVIEQAGLVPSGADLTQLWQALLRSFSHKSVFSIAGAGMLKMTDLEPDSYYQIWFTADTAAAYTVFASTNNGATNRTDYTHYNGTTRANIIAQEFSFGGDMDVVDIYTGTAGLAARFFTQQPFVVTTNLRLTNPPLGPVNAITIATDAAFYATVVKIQ